MTNKEITYGEIRNGMEVYICGHLFKVSEVKTEEDPISVVNFVGTCTDDRCNNDIRNSGYNGGTYGGGADAPCWINASEEE